jgi:hypothetical protein
MQMTAATDTVPTIETVPTSDTVPTKGLPAIAALCLRQLRYWLGVKGGLDHEGEHFVYKSAKELADELLEFYQVEVSPKTVERALRFLVERGWLKRAQLKVHRFFRTFFYSVGPLLESVASKVPSRPSRNDTVGASLQKQLPITTPTQNKKNQENLQREIPDWVERNKKRAAEHQKQAPQKVITRNYAPGDRVGSFVVLDDGMWSLADATLAPATSS